MVAFAENLKRPLWIASGSVTGGVRQFGTPVLHKWNWRTLSTTVGMMVFGPNYMDYRRAITSADEVMNVKRLDRVWMDVEPPENDPLATTADFFVSGINPGVGGITEVLFRRLSEDQTEDVVS